MTVVRLQRHAYVDSLDVHCRTPLMLCAAFNVCEACVLLLDGGAEACATDLEGNTALHLAYAYGSWTCALYMESRGAEGGAEGGALSEARNNCGRTPSEEAGRYANLCPLLSVADRPESHPESETRNLN
jgi:ankyrin repeat protein